MDSESNKKIEGLLCMSTPMPIRKLILLFLIAFFISCPISSFSAEAAAVANIDIPLQEGWNLVSIPLTPTNKTLPAPLESIDGNYTSIFAYNSSRSGFEWESFVSNRPSFLNVLRDINESRGLWINMSNNDTLAVNGTVQATTSFMMKKGWNLIGYPALTSQKVTTALENVNETFSIIFAYNASDAGNEWKFYDPTDPSSTLRTMDPGFGYWVNATKDATWTFNETQYDTPKPDFTISSMVTTPLIPTYQDMVTLNIATHNVGIATAKNVTVNIWDEYQGNRTLLTTLYWPYGIPTGSVEESVVSLGYLNGGNHTFTAEVDPEDTIREENETNNEQEYNVCVLSPLIATINVTLTAGEVPLKVNFTGNASGGIPPYAFIWDGGITQYPSTLKRGEHVQYIYSIPGNCTPSLSVTDQRRYSAWDIINLTLLNNSLTQQTDFSIDITDISVVSNNSVRINTTTNNLEPVDIDAVRVIIRVYNSDDPFSFDEIFYDDIIRIPGNSSKDITTIADNLKPGNYTARADINYYGAIPESDWVNYTNNADLQDFTFTGLGYLPPISIDNISFFPSEPIVNNMANVKVNVSNNGLYYRLIQGKFYCINSTNDREFIGNSRIEKVEVGGSVILARIFRTPIRENTTVYVDIVDVLMNSRIVANDSKEVTITPYDFSVSNLSVYPETNASDAVPLEITAQINNLREACGHVRYSLIVDSFTVVGPFTAYNVPVNGSKSVTFILGWRENDSFVSHPGALYTLPKPIVGHHSIQILLESIEAEKPWSDMFESNVSNNVIGRSISILKGPDCRIQSVEFYPHPEVKKNINITIELSNEGQVGDNFTISVLEDFLTVVANATIYLAPNASDSITLSWIPSKAGHQYIDFQCGGNRYSKEIWVYPRFYEVDTDYYIDYSTSKRGVADAHYYYAYIYDENRLKLWALANTFAGNSISHIKGAVYKEIVVDDGTDGNDSYGGYVYADVGYAGIIDSLSFGSFTDMEYGTIIIVGITESDKNDWKNGRVIYARASDDDIFYEQMGIILDTMSFVAGLAPVVGGYISGGTLIIEVAQFAEDFEECVGFGYYNYTTRIPFGFQQPFEFQNKKKYKVFIYSESIVDATGSALGGGHVYTDFYNREPYECAQSDEMPKRGIWLNNLEFDVKYRKFG